MAQVAGKKMGWRSSAPEIPSCDVIHKQRQTQAANAAVPILPCGRRGASPERNQAADNLFATLRPLDLYSPAHSEREGKARGRDGGVAPRICSRRKSRAAATLGMETANLFGLPVISSTPTKHTGA